MEMNITAVIAQIVFVGIPVLLVVLYFTRKRKKNQRSGND